MRERWTSLPDVARRATPWLAAASTALYARAALLGSLGGFGAGWYALLLGRGATPAVRLLALVAGAAGGFSAGGPRGAVGFLAGSAVLELLWLPWSRRGRGRAGAAAVAALAASAVMLAGRDARWLLAVSLPSAALGGSLVFLGERALVRREAIERWTDLLPVAFLAGAAAAGLRGLALGPVALQPVPMALAVLSLGTRAGAGAGAAAGAVAGTLLALSAGEPVAAASLALGGYLAGAAARLGRGAAALGMAAGAAAVILAYGGAPMAGAGVPEALTGSLLLGEAGGALLFLVLPARWLDWIAASLPRPGDPGPGTTRRLAQLSLLLEDVARRVEMPVGRPKPAGPPEMEELIGQVTGGPCQGCPAFQECWERRLVRRRRELSDLAALLEEAGEEAALPEAWRPPRCLRPPAVRAAVERWLARRRGEHVAARRLEQGRFLLASQITGVAKVVGALAEEAAAAVETRAWTAAEPVLGCAIGAASWPAREGAPSGDRHAAQSLEGDRIALLLSDGMGSGLAAAREGEAVLELLGRLLAAHFPPAVAVETASALFTLRTPRESVAALDLVLLDLRRARLESIKAGAPPSFLLRGGDVEVLVQQGPPLGAPDFPRPTPLERPLEAGDLLIVATDGLLSALGVGAEGVTRLRQLLRRPLPREPQEAADRLLALALAACGGEPKDDMTVVTVRLLPEC
ncbi:MAG: SpoIIE family protein phosphatase [Bacillota bacterium]|nr:SpoIIE family protein phosphatase [Bacillota bacterium]